MISSMYKNLPTFSFYSESSSAHKIRRNIPEKVAQIAVPLILIIVADTIPTTEGNPLFIATATATVAATASTNPVGWIALAYLGFIGVVSVGMTLTLENDPEDSYSALDAQLDGYGDD